MISTKMHIQKFNHTFIDENENKINIIDYINILNEFFYNDDIIFIGDFINLVEKNQCCIHHDMLIMVYFQRVTSLKIITFITQHYLICF